MADRSFFADLDNLSLTDTGKEKGDDDKQETLPESDEEQDIDQSPEEKPRTVDALAKQRGKPEQASASPAARLCRRRRRIGITVGTAVLATAVCAAALLSLPSATAPKVIDNGGAGYSAVLPAGEHGGLYIPDHRSAVLQVREGDLSADMRLRESRIERRSGGVYDLPSDHMRICRQTAASYPQMLGINPDKCVARLLAFDFDRNDPSVYQPAELPEDTGHLAQFLSGISPRFILETARPAEGDTRLLLPICSYDTWRGYWDTGFVYHYYLPDAYTQSADGSLMAFLVAGRRTGREQLLLYDGETLRAVGSYEYEGRAPQTGRSLNWFSNISMSPDGRYIAFQSNRRAYAQADETENLDDVWIYDLQKQKEQLLYQKGYLAEDCWHNGLLFFHSFHDNGGAGRVCCAADPATGEMRSVMSFPTGQGFIKSGRYIQSNDNRISITDLSTGVTDSFICGEGLPLTFQQECVFSDDGRYWAGLFGFEKTGGGNPQPRIGIADLKTGNTWVFNPPTTAYVQSGLMTFLRMDADVLLVQLPESRGTYTIYLGELPPAS